MDETITQLSARRLGFVSGEKPQVKPKASDLFLNLAKWFWRLNVIELRPLSNINYMLEILAGRKTLYVAGMRTLSRYFKYVILLQMGFTVELVERLLRLIQIFFMRQ